MRPLQRCSWPLGCNARVSSGLCPDHHRQGHQERRERRTLTYSESWWRAFREWFISALVAARIVPACGAALPGGPTSTYSRCRDAGVMTLISADGSSLHLDHEPDLTDAEAHDRAIVTDPLRCVLLCRACHNAKHRGARWR